MTCSARVGLSRPERLALGAASAPPKAAITARAGPRGARSAIGRQLRRDERMHRRIGGERHDDGQRPRPEFLRQQFRATIEPAVAARHRDIGDVADQRIEARSALRREDARDGFAVRRVRGEPVDGLGGQRDQFPGAQQRRGLSCGLKGV